MSERIYEIDGVRYLTSGQVAKHLGINQRTVIRWTDRSRKPRGAALLKQLVWIRDPVNGYRYFREDTILALQAHILIKRPIRVRR